MNVYLMSIHSQRKPPPESHDGEGPQGWNGPITG